MVIFKDSTKESLLQQGQDLWQRQNSIQRQPDIRRYFLKGKVMRCKAARFSGYNTESYKWFGTKVWKHGKWTLLSNQGDYSELEYHQDKLKTFFKYYQNGNKFSGYTDNSKNKIIGVYEFIDGLKYTGEIKKIRCIEMERLLIKMEIGM